MSDPDVIIQLDNLTKRYGSFTALDGLTLDVPPGIVGLLGPNGAGKSTLINCLLGHTPATSGEATVLGCDIRRQQPAIRRQIGYVPEHECFIPGLTGVGYVSYAGRLAGMPPKQALARAHDMLDLLALENERYRPVESYSTGMKQRAKFAQALVHDPRLVLMDEPTNGLDPSGRRLMLALIRELGEKGISIMLSSHLLPDVEAVCEHVIVLGRGRVLECGSMDHLHKPMPRACSVKVSGDLDAFRRELAERGVAIEDDLSELWKLELPEDDAHQLVVQAARGAGVGLHRLQQKRTSLEEMFMKAVRQQDVLLKQELTDDGVVPTDETTPTE